MCLIYQTTARERKHVCLTTAGVVTIPPAGAAAWSSIRRAMRVSVRLLSSWWLAPIWLLVPNWFFLAPMWLLVPAGSFLTPIGWLAPIYITRSHVVIASYMYLGLCSPTYSSASPDSIFWLNVLTSLSCLSDNIANCSVKSMFSHGDAKDICFFWHNISWQVSGMATLFGAWSCSVL